MDDLPNSIVDHHPGRGFQVCHVATYFGQKPRVVVFEDLRETRPIRIPIEGDHVSPLGEEGLDHPSPDEAPRPGDQHHISIAHFAMLRGQQGPSDRLTAWR